MKLKTILIGAAFAALSLSGRAEVPRDKKMHAGVSFVLGMAAAHQFPDRPVLAWGVAMTPGLLKELSDKSGTGFSGKDIAANAIGAALGVATTNWLISRSNGTTVVAYRTEF